MEYSQEYLISQGLFIKFIGIIYLIAFCSLLSQVLGLYGSKGIQPIALVMNRLKENYERVAFDKIPSIFWLDSSDRYIQAVCLSGVFSSLLVVFGVYPAIFLAINWMLYASFFFVGSPFLNFQWDVLLLEVGFLSIFFAIQSPPTILFVYVLWFLLFRFMFSSGITKLLFGSREWRELTAMNYHYETQPLPTKLGYYSHFQPRWLGKLSVLGVHLFEIVIPFFIFAPDYLRIAAFVSLVFLQVAIILTGNFAYFNLLTIAMCIPLLPDWLLLPVSSWASFRPIVSDNFIIWGILSFVAVFFLIINALELISLFVSSNLLMRLLRPLHLYSLIGSYGLFVQMTTYRDEIIVEGSDDGEDWKPYEFKWKPDNPKKAPRIVAPYQPRLDWQMWFAALSYVENNPWFSQFVIRLLQGSDDVIKLLKTNPFPDHPPKYIRSVVYRYHYADLKTKRKTGDWWTREYIGLYSLPHTL